MPASPRRRAFGQHFLRDTKVIDLIVRTTFDRVADAGARGLLEIGPGKGAITRPLLEAFAGTPGLERFLIVEKDRRLADFWIDECRSVPRVEVISSDFLDVTPEKILERSPLVVVSNLPYSSGTAILQMLAAFGRAAGASGSGSGSGPGGIRSMVLMFQAEVAARLRAVPSDKAWGSLSIWIQNRWDVKKLAFVPPGAFVPPPDVNSEVVVLEARAEARVSPPAGLSAEAVGRWDETFEKLVRVSFLHRRKMLRSGLPQGSPFKEALERAGIDGTRRAEDLGWDDWQRWMVAVLGG